MDPAASGLSKLDSSAATWSSTTAAAAAGLSRNRSRRQTRGPGRRRSNAASLVARCTRRKRFASRVRSVEIGSARSACSRLASDAGGWAVMAEMYASRASCIWWKESVLADQGVRE